MEKATVYFTNFRCSVGTSQLDKLRRLCILENWETWHSYVPIMQKQ